MSKESEQNGLPKGWQWTTIGDTGRYINGVAFKPTDWGDRGFPIVRIQNLTDREKPLNRTTRQVDSVYRIETGDLLVSWSATLDAFIWDRETSLLNQHIFKVVPHESIADRRFLFYLLKSAISDLIKSEHLHGSTMKHINRGPFLAHRVAVPSIAHQRRIVAKIEELFSDLDAGVAALERVKANLKRYRGSVLKSAVEGKLTAKWRKEHPNVEPASKLLERILIERRKRWEADQLAKFKALGKTPPKDWKNKYEEPVAPDKTNLPELPMGWCWATMDQLIRYLRNGWSLKPSQSPPGHRILRINAVRPMKIDLDEVRYVNKPEDVVSGYFIELGDLLFTRYNGSIDLLGVAAMVRVIDEPTLHPDKLIRVHTVLDKPLNHFVELACNVGISRKHMQRRARTTAGQTGISGSDIRQMPIPLCSLDEQRHIIREIEQCLSTVGRTQVLTDVSAAKALRLRQSILKRAFEGNLVPQDPKDDPAEIQLGLIGLTRHPPVTTASSGTPPRRQRTGV